MTRTLTRVLGLVAALLCGALGVVVAPTPAYACECAQRSTLRALDDAEAVFRGTVTDRDEVKQGKNARVDFRLRVDAVYKGVAYTDQVVATPGGSDTCGFDPEVGSTWVVFATESIEGTGSRAVSRLVTSQCSGNLRSSETPGFVREVRPPIPGASDREEQAVATDARLTRVLVVGGLVLGGLVVLAGAGLGVVWRPRRPGT